jgi:predicted nucleotidyltransferase
VDADELTSKVAIWSQRDNRVIAAGVCGSHARGDAEPDSDIDLIILTEDPGSLLEERSWIRGIGANARIAGPVEDYNLVQSIRVFFDATEVEFGITDQAWAQLPIDSETAQVINDGLRILFDPEDRLREAIAYASSIRALLEEGSPAG